MESGLNQEISLVIYRIILLENNLQHTIEEEVNGRKRRSTGKKQCQNNRQYNFIEE